MQPEPEKRPFKVSGLLLAAVVVLFGLHQASWLNADSHLIAGLPAGLAYHLGYCLLVSLVLGFFVYRRRS